MAFSAAGVAFLSVVVAAVGVAAAVVVVHDAFAPGLLSLPPFSPSVFEST